MNVKQSLNEQSRVLHIRLKVNFEFRQETTIKMTIFEKLTKGVNKFRQNARQ